MLRHWGSLGHGLRSVARSFGRSKLQQRDLGRALITHRHNDGPDAAGNVDLRIVSAMKPSLQSTLGQDALFGIAHFDLAAVRVSAKCQVDPAASDTAKYDGVVSKQQLHLVGERTLERRFQIGLSD